MRKNVGMIPRSPFEVSFDGWMVHNLNSVEAEMRYTYAKQLLTTLVFVVEIFGTRAKKSPTENVQNWLIICHLPWFDCCCLGKWRWSWCWECWWCTIDGPIPFCVLTVFRVKNSNQKTKNLLECQWCTIDGPIPFCVLIVFRAKNSNQKTKKLLECQWCTINGPNPFTSLSSE